MRNKTKPVKKERFQRQRPFDSRPRSEIKRFGVKYVNDKIQKRSKVLRIKSQYAEEEQTVRSGRRMPILVKEKKSYSKVGRRLLRLAPVLDKRSILKFVSTAWYLTSRYRYRRMHLMPRISRFAFYKVSYMTHSLGFRCYYISLFMTLQTPLEFFISLFIFFFHVFYVIRFWKLKSLNRNLEWFMLSSQPNNGCYKSVLSFIFLKSFS